MQLFSSSSFIYSLDGGVSSLITDQLRRVRHTRARIIFSVIPVYVGAMFHCRGNVSGATLLPRVLYASRALHNHRAMCCCRVYRRLTAMHAVVSRSRETPPPDLAARARMAVFALNAAAPRREYSDARNGDRSVLGLGELESLPPARSPAPVAIQTRRSSTTPEKTQEERAANTQTVSSVSGAEGQRSDEKPSKTQQLRKVFKEYGSVGISFHIGISLISLGMFYLAVSSGLDVTALLCKLGFSESVVQSRLAAGTSTFVLAYAVHKLFAPLRISITLVCVPLIVRHLRRTGLFRAGPNRP
ncbi:protein FAM210B, mitochondrial isoform X2 [Carassius carassius]|uniref:protein FAM210B, mitochondrial isoform X2 n=1 Tax=Carassius carassius TaxID=217509 RepID=UPI002869492B|nr:protein FAM210B, mitochondrial isoform X2 [Carassius carassius]